MQTQVHTFEVGPIRRDDDRSVTLEVMRSGGANTLAQVAVYTGEDGALVVHVDTLVDTGHVRINLNDNTVYDGDPEVDE